MSTSLTVHMLAMWTQHTKENVLRNNYSFLSIFYLCFYFFFCLNTEMSNAFSSEQTSKTSNLDFLLILRQYKLDFLAKCTEINFVNPKISHDQIAKEIECSRFTLQRCTQEINKLSPYRFPSNSNKRPQMISKENNIVADSVTETVADSASHALSANKPARNKNNLKEGGKIESDDENLFHNCKFFIIVLTYNDCITDLQFFCYLIGISNANYLQW